MSDFSQSPVQPGATRHHSPTPFLIALIVLIGIAAAVYFGLVQDRGPKTIKLALVTWTEDPFWDPLLQGAQDCASQANVQLTVIRSKPTVDAQNEHIRSLLDSGVDGIAISPNDASAQAAILKETAGKVPVVTFDTDAPDSGRRRFVGIDNYAAGHMAADELREALPEGGNVLISVGSVTQSHGRERRQGLIDGLLERGFDRDRKPDPMDAPLKGSKYTVTTTVTDGGDPAKGVTTIADALKAHPEVNAVVGLYSYSAPSALEAMKQAGMNGKVKVVGFDEAVETQAAIEAGAIHSSILQDSYRAGYESIEVLANEVRGVARGPVESDATFVVGTNVLSTYNLAAMRDAGKIRTAEPKTPATQP